MNVRKILLPGILLALIILSGCGNQAYDAAMANGMKAVDNEGLEVALDYFKEASQENPSDDKAATAIEQIELILLSFEELRNEETLEAISMLEKAANNNQGSEIIINKANEILNETVAIDQQIQRVNDLINNQYFEEAFQQIEDSLRNIDERDYLLPFEKQLISLKEDVKGAELFTYIVGYSNNSNNNLEVCQITKDDIMCTVLTVDLYSYEEIKSVELESDDTLKLVLQNGTDLVISNISQDSYDMHDRTYNKTSAEAIVNLDEYYHSIEDIFDRETFQAILKNGTGYHQLFNSNEQAKLDNFSFAEIEYASVWLDYVNEPNPPQLSVSFKEKGDPINIYMGDDPIVYPEDVTILSGESIHDGSITYGSDGDGTIRVYDIPDRWHQQSDEEMREAAEEVLKTIKYKDVPAGNDDDVLNILSNMIVYE